MTPRTSLPRRIGLLIGLTLAGMMVGYLGASLTGNEAWYLCVPGAVALGWLFVATPDRCLPDDDSRR